MTSRKESLCPFPSIAFGDKAGALCTLVRSSKLLREMTKDETIENAVRDVLTSIGEDPAREGLVGTPKRVARMYGELLGGYGVDPTALLNGALFDVEHEQMVIVTNIEFQSLCEHHMLPFTGVAHVAYVPHGKVVGLSKIPRIVDMYARRLQIQERMTKQIGETISTLVEPLGVGVFVTGSHMCSTIRGVRKQNSRMTTNFFSGSLKSDNLLSSQFLSQINIDKE